MKLEIRTQNHCPLNTVFIISNHQRRMNKRKKGKEETKQTGRVLTRWLILYAPSVKSMFLHMSVANLGQSKAGSPAWCPAMSTVSLLDNFCGTVYKHALVSGITDIATQSRNKLASQGFPGGRTKFHPAPMVHAY